MSTFVLLHGAWHGGWCWERVTPRLAAAGHRVTAPTLTGLGERRHLASAAVDLDTHVEDVLNHLTFAGLEDVVLVAHSYAGFVAYGVAERAAGAIARLVLLDAFVPRRDGDTMADHVGERGEQYRAAAAEDPGWLAPAPPVAALGVTEPADVEWVQARLTPQPVATYLQPLALTGAADGIDTAYVACTVAPLVTLGESRRVVAEQGWPVSELACGHDAMVAAPAALAAALLG